MNELQKNLFRAAVSNNPPFLTNDPVVNHAIDQHMADSQLEYDENYYLREIYDATSGPGVPRKLLAFI